jgi:hypothetical protein
MTANQAQLKAMIRVMTFCVNTKDQGITIEPKGKWDPHNNQPYTITGVSDSDYAKDTVTRRSVSGHVVFINNSLISAKSKMQEAVTLSVTEAELMALTSCIQDMLHLNDLLTSIGLSVKLPMTIKVDNKGAKDLVNNWSIGRRTRHIGVHLNFLCELKEMGIIEVSWIKSEDNVADILTKNLAVDLYQKHVKSLGIKVPGIEFKNVSGEGVKDTG